MSETHDSDLVVEDAVPDEERPVDCGEPDERADTPVEPDWWQTATDELNDLWPDGPEARERWCPTCRAKPGKPCVGVQGNNPRSTHHFLRRDEGEQ